MDVAPRHPLRPAVLSAWRWLVGVAVALPGVLTLIWALGPDDAPWHGRWALHAYGVTDTFPTLLSVIAGIGMIVLAHGLVRGKRRAADATIAILCTVAAVRVAIEMDALVTVGILAFATLLYATRPAFARGSRAKPALLPGTLALGSAVGAYMVATVAALVTDQVTSLSATLATDLTGRSEPQTLADNAPLGLGLDALLLVGVAATLYLVHELLRPGPAADGHTPEEHERAARIVARHGTDSLAPFALREDKAYFFAHDGLVAYRTLRETAVVSGDPIGPRGSAPQILADFEDFAHKHGWDVVVTAASAEHLAGYTHSAGMRALHIGNEAIVDPQAFTLEGRPIRKVRQSVHRIERHGWAIEVVPDQALDATTRQELDAVEHAWRVGRSRIQGFAMTLGRLWGVSGDVGGMYVLARDADGELRAFLRFLEYRRGLSLDVMRRLGDEPNGLNEAMVVAALKFARERGDREVSLNFAGFAHLMAAEAALNRRQRLLGRLLHLAHGRFQLERLVRFNDKFFPAWQPRHLVYGRRTHLPLAALRVLQAEAYLRPPRSRPLRARWRAHHGAAAGASAQPGTSR
jgi:lysyl-tRNA synthetase class 2